MPMLESAVAMITSQQPSSEALPAKHRPEVMPTIGTSPLSWRSGRRSPEPKSPPSVSPGRPPPPSANSTSGSRPCSAMSISRSVLRWFWMPCVPAKTV